MPDLVALDVPPGPDFVAHLQRCWEDGHAVLPVDQRLPGPARAELFAAMRPTALIDASGRHHLADGLPTESGDALVVATSGSTGRPKGVILTHAAVEASALASTRALGVSEADRWLACLPLAHIGGLSVVTRALMTGTALTVIERFEATRVSELARTCTLVSLVPTALTRIDPHLFRLVLLGGSRPPRDLPDNVVTTYGSTETGSGVVYDGRPLDGVELAIASDGEILVRGAMLMRGYRDGSTAIDADGWLHTDDEGEWREDGRLHVHGRRGDVIVTGGQKVWPEPVERAISDAGITQESCILGLDDDEWGERVVLVTTDRDLVLGRVRDAVCDALPAYCAPREILRVEEIPRTPLGKVRRAELKRRLSAGR